MKHWRPREDRKTVRISVRVRTDAGWIEATVRNVSSRGMMLHCFQPLRRNQFVEIARGRSRVVGRIVWSDSSMCGLQAQDRVDLSGLLARPQGDEADPGLKRRGDDRPSPQDRLAALAERAATSRLIGRALEKIMMVSAIACAGGLAVASSLEAVAAPLEQIHTALDPSGD